MKNSYFRRELRVVSREVSYRKKSFFGLVVAVITILSLISATESPTTVEDTSAAEENATFQVNVQDSLAVAITSPSSGATGNVGDFLRNTVNLSVDSNVTNGFTASMYSNGDTNLTHSDLTSYNISTLASSIQRSSFPSDRWGYSLKSASLDGHTYGETDAGNTSSYYYPLTSSTTSPITILSGASGVKSGTQSIYFGAKASLAKPAGTYTNTVVISVVTGVVNPSTNPITPTDPATQNTDTTINDNQATYTGNNTTTGVGISQSNGTTVYATRTSTGSGTSATTTNTTEVTGGDNTYAYPQGVSKNSTNNKAFAAKTPVETGVDSPLPVGLAVGAASAAVAGGIFFLLAKKRDDDDEEEGQQ